MSILEDFQQKKPEILRDILLYFKRAATPEDQAIVTRELAQMREEETAQFIRGFLDVLEQELIGNKGAYKEYLHLIILPLKQAGLTLPLAGCAIAPMYSVIAAHLGVAHLDWLTLYMHEYSKFFFNVWEGL
jgi:hypothetical protein